MATAAVAPAKESFGEKILSVLKAGEHDVLVALEFVGKETPLLETMAEGAAIASGNAAILPAIVKFGTIAQNSGALALQIDSAASGQAKLAIASQGTDQLLKSSGLFGTHTIADEQKYNVAVTAIASSFAQLFDSLVKKPAVSAAPPAPPAPVEESASAPESQQVAISTIEAAPGS